MAEEGQTADVEYLTDDYSIRKVLPVSLRADGSVTVEVPVFRAYNDESTPGPKPAKSSGPVFKVKVNVQRPDGERSSIGLWDPQSDDEYLTHGCIMEGVGHAHYNRDTMAVRIEEWLNELLEENMGIVEDFITDDQR